MSAAIPSDQTSQAARAICSAVRSYSAGSDVILATMADNVSVIRVII